MDALLKNLGIILLIAGVILLVITTTDKGENNTGLMLSGLLVLIGLVVHIILNRKYS